MNAEEHPAGKDPAIGRDSLMAPQYPPCSIRHAGDAMKTTKQFTLIALFAAGLALPAFAQKAVNTPSGKLEFKNG